MSKGETIGPGALAQWTTTWTISTGAGTTPGLHSPAKILKSPNHRSECTRTGLFIPYSYRNQDSTGQRDNIYGPPDDAVYDDDDFDRQGYINLSQPEDYGDPPAAGGPSVDYGSDGYPGQDLNEPEMAEDGVVDADYRVIIPPSPSASEDTANAETASGSDTWEDRGDDDDDLGSVEDALSP